MQTLDVISVNIWQILISLCNLLILFLILKRFLFKPVQKTLDKRQAEVDEEYRAAEDAKQQAHAEESAYREKLEGAQSEADALLHTAQANAKKRSNEIIAQAEQEAGELRKRAERDVQLEKKKAAGEMKTAIADISVELAQKILKREIRPEDHRDMIEEFMEEIGEENGSGQ